MGGNHWLLSMYGWNDVRMICLASESILTGGRMGQINVTPQCMPKRCPQSTQNYAKIEAAIWKIVIIL
jgi:hypothetical protein